MVLAVGSERGCKTRGFGSPPRRFVCGAAWSFSQHGSRVLRMSIPNDRRSYKALGVWKCGLCLILLATPSQTHMASRARTRCCLPKAACELIGSTRSHRLLLSSPCCSSPCHLFRAGRNFTLIAGESLAHRLLSLQACLSKNCLPQLHLQL